MGGNAVRIDDDRITMIPERLIAWPPRAPRGNPPRRPRSDAVAHGTGARRGAGCR
jgi:hypothetical protein